MLWKCYLLEILLICYNSKEKLFVILLGNLQQGLELQKITKLSCKFQVKHDVKKSMAASRLGQLDNQARLASQDSLDSQNSQA